MKARTGPRPRGRLSGENGTFPPAPELEYFDNSRRKNYKLKAEKTTKEVALTRKIHFAIAVVLALLLAALPSMAGRRTAAVTGKISDSQGFPLAGAYLHVTSPSLLSIYNFITTETGRYVFPDLSPGVYTITVERPEFKTVKAEGIVLEPGATLLLDFKMEPSAVEEETVTRTPDVGLDRSSARLASVLDRDLLTHIPLPRDLPSILELVPGVVVASDFPILQASVHGTPVTANAFLVDGVNVTDPLTRVLATRIDVDALEQVVVETAGLAADRGPGRGAKINVIHRAGSNSGYSSLGLYYTGQGLSNSLWSEDELNASHASSPRPDKANLDTSFTAGGPVLHDMGWFFSDVRLRLRSQDAPFQPSIDPLYLVHPAYTWKGREFYGLFKLSVYGTKQFKGSAEMSFFRAREPVYSMDLAWNRPQESTRHLDLTKFFLLRADVAYTLNERTLVNFSAGYTVGRETLPLNEDGQLKPSYSDLGTGQIWGSGPYNDDQKRKRLLVNVALTSFRDRILGANHEFAVGADYETGKGQSSSWKKDNLVMYYLDGSPYNLGQAVSPSSGNTVGLGQIGFSVIPGNPAQPLGVTRDLKRLGGFAQDTLTFGGRVSLSLGLRFDHSETNVESIAKTVAGNAVSVGIGDSIIKPIFGFNPFGSGSYGGRDALVTWDSFSPRFGLSIDLFGTGRTVLRGSYAKIPEDLGLGYIRDLDPVALDRIHQFYWYDEDGDGKVGMTDVYQPFPENYAIYSALYSLRVEPGLRAPVMDEWTAGVDHELMRDFSLGVRYISRSQKKAVGDVMYDPDSDRPWYTVEGSPDGWWVPFQTTVPASEAYPATDVTIYLRSTSAPLAFDRIQSVPELTWKYRGLEFSFRKRMSHNWQLFGSVVWSRSTGTAGLAGPLASGLTSPVLTPNSFINVPADSRSNLDRPLAIRVMGTLRLKHEFYLSALYRYMSGSPWARTLTITPPADWATEHDAYATPITVFMESPGTRRHSSMQSTDLRLEKVFLRGGRARWTVFLDVLNLFGNKYSIVDYNDGAWYPAGEGASTGTHRLSATYGQAVYLSGARTLALSVKLGF